MNVVGTLTDMKFLVVVALIAGTFLPNINANQDIVVFVLMIQMMLSMDTLVFNRDIFRMDRKFVLRTMFLSNVFNTVITLLTGLPYLLANEISVWYGWAMIAAVPCGICVIVICVLTKGDVLNSFRSTVLCYSTGLIYTPLVTLILLGDAVNPLEILQYMFLFIIVPFLLSRILAKRPLRREIKVPIINILIGLLIFFPLNNYNGIIYDNMIFVLILFLVCVVRTLVLHFGSLWFIRFRGIDDSQKTMYLTLGVMKSTGLALSMVMLVLPNVPEATFPCFISVIVDVVWLAIMTKLYEVKDEPPVAVAA